MTSHTAHVGIAAGYRLAVVGPDGTIIGTVDLKGYDLTKPTAAVALADEVLDELPASAIVPLVDLDD